MIRGIAVREAHAEREPARAKPQVMRAALIIAGSFLLLATSSGLLFAKCPVSDGATVVVRAPAGDLQVDTSARDSVADVQVDNSLIQVQETCGKETVEFTGNAPDPTQIRSAVIWRIVTPRNVNLDLVTMTGNISIADTDANAILRTAGGSITTGQIKGKAALITQGGSVKAGNIGGDAEIRSQGGTLEVGDIGGNAEFHTTAGQIRAGTIAGSVTAEGGRAIFIIKAGDVKATTNAGDISIGDAERINAKTTGGTITSRRVRGPFQGHTESGDIRLDNAAAWVEASTGAGNIVVHVMPDNIDGDLHMDLQAGIGDVTIYIPPRIKATIDATVQRPAFQAQQIISDFPMSGIAPGRPVRGLIPNNRFFSPTHSQSLLNGGGNQITLHTSLGKIIIHRQ
jgi:DUF4097 and DUF4098 domain-containing protein YvlB